MKINDLLVEKKPKILQRWFDSILSTYPSDTLNFLKGQKNPFADSIAGQTIFKGIQGIFDELIGESDAGRINSYLDNIIRVRAIQEFEPSQAVGFISQLKNIIRTELADEIQENEYFEELLGLESKIDDYLLIAFDIYVKCREKIYELKANEMKNWTYRVVKRSKMYREVPAEENFMKTPDSPISVRVDSNKSGNDRLFK